MNNCNIPIVVLPTSLFAISSGSESNDSKKKSSKRRRRKCKKMSFENFNLSSLPFKVLFIFGVIVVLLHNKEPFGSQVNDRSLRALGEYYGNHEGNRGPWSNEQNVNYQGQMAVPYNGEQQFRMHDPYHLENYDNNDMGNSEGPSMEVNRDFNGLQNPSLCNNTHHNMDDPNDVSNREQFERMNDDNGQHHPMEAVLVGPPGSNSNEQVLQVETNDYNGDTQYNGYNENINGDNGNDSTPREAEGYDGSEGETLTGTHDYNNVVQENQEGQNENNNNNLTPEGNDSNAGEQGNYSTYDESNAQGSNLGGGADGSTANEDIIRRGLENLYNKIDLTSREDLALKEWITKALSGNLMSKTNGENQQLNVESPNQEGNEMEEESSINEWMNKQGYGDLYNNLNLGDPNAEHMENENNERNENEHEGNVSGTNGESGESQMMPGNSNMMDFRNQQGGPGVPHMMPGNPNMMDFRNQQEGGPGVPHMIPGHPNMMDPRNQQGGMMPGHPNMMNPRNQQEGGPGVPHMIPGHPNMMDPRNQQGGGRPGEPHMMDPRNQQEGGLGEPHMMPGHPNMMDPRNQQGGGRPGEPHMIPGHPNMMDPRNQQGGGPGVPHMLPGHPNMMDMMDPRNQQGGGPGVPHMLPGHPNMMDPRNQQGGGPGVPHMIPGHPNMMDPRMQGRGGRPGESCMIPGYPSNIRGQSQEEIKRQQEEDAEIIFNLRSGKKIDDDEEEEDPRKSRSETRGSTSQTTRRNRPTIIGSPHNPIRLKGHGASSSSHHTSSRRDESSHHRRSREEDYDSGSNDARRGGHRNRRQEVGHHSANGNGVLPFGCSQGELQEQLSEEELNERLKGLRENASVKEMFTLFNQVIFHERKNFVKMQEYIMDYSKYLQKTMMLPTPIRMKYWWRAHYNMTDELIKKEKSDFNDYCAFVNKGQCDKYNFLYFVKAKRASWKELRELMKSIWMEILTYKMKKHSKM
ncbi:Phist protein (Pf-fam-b) [Plasmodium malariae]|uniref:Phist protein (Pf-fam-b) n=1 Tax=Plasmodium malariae TaxID=5858 RepID=A0A1A8WTQ2_PLAMA|nr:Phist protein (Pf-fam-b) [Plasmodium malariae]